MAIIKRCVICDEKLVRNRCPFCGLDHTSRMKMKYRLNTSRPYQMPTQQDTAAQKRNSAQLQKSRSAQTVTNRKRANQPHTVPNRKRASQPQTVPNKRRTNAPRTVLNRDTSVSRTEYSTRTTKPVREPQVKQQKNGQIWTRFLPLILFVGMMLVNLWDDEFAGSYEFESEDMVQQNVVHEDYYQDVWYDLAQEGENFEIVLSQGEYLVGTHLPEGYYHVELVNGSGILDITNVYHSVFDWYDFEEEETTQLEDLPLYQDTQLVVTQGVQLALSTKNGQIDAMHETVANPLPLEELVLEEDIAYVVGTDIAAGVYDLKQIEGSCYFVTGSLGDTDSAPVKWIYRDMWIYNDSDENVYRNLVLEEGMVAYLDPDWEGTTVLIPSEVVNADGYDTYYELYR